MWTYSTLSYLLKLHSFASLVLNLSVGNVDGRASRLYPAFIGLEKLAGAPDVDPLSVSIMLTLQSKIPHLAAMN